MAITIGEYIAQKVREALDASVGDTKRDWEDIARSGGNAAAGGIVGDIGRLAGILEAIPLLGGIVGDIIDPAKVVIDAADSEGGHLGKAFGAGYIGGYMIYQLLNPLALPLEHAIQSLTTNEIHDPNTAADLVVRGLFEQGHGADEASGSGLDGDHFNRLLALAETRPSLAQLLDLRNRGEITESDLTETMHRLGYNADWQKVLPQLARALLSPADLALGVLRGNIDQQAGEQYAAKTGVTADDFRTLVENTGEPPGLQQLDEAYRRGFIDKARLERGIRQSRIRNEWIDVIEALRFEPMSVADSVRAVVENYLTPAEGQRIAEQNGLEPSAYPVLIEAFGRPLAHMEMGSLVHRGLASMDQFNQAMRESDIKDKYIPQSFLTTERLIPERLIVAGIHYGAITLKEGAKRLLQLGYAQDNVNLILQLGLAEQHAAGHNLTRAEIVTLYQDGVLTKQQAEAHLTGLGYAADVAAYVLQISDISTHAKEVKAEVAVIRNNYLAGAIDKQQALNEQIHAGVDAGQATKNLATWDREKRRAARNLSEAQIVKAGKEKAITYPHAVSLLVALGYSQDNAAILLHSNGVTA